MHQTRPWNPQGSLTREQWERSERSRIKALAKQRQSWPPAFGTQMFHHPPPPPSIFHAAPAPPLQNVFMHNPSVRAPASWVGQAINEGFGLPRNIHDNITSLGDISNLPHNIHGFRTSFGNISTNAVAKPPMRGIPNDPQFEEDVRQQMVKERRIRDEAKRRLEAEDVYSGPMYNNGAAPSKGSSSQATNVSFQCKNTLLFNII